MPHNIDCRRWPTLRRPSRCEKGGILSSKHDRIGDLKRATDGGFESRIGVGVFSSPYLSLYLHRTPSPRPAPTTSPQPASTERRNLAAPSHSQPHSATTTVLLRLGSSHAAPVLPHPSSASAGCLPTTALRLLRRNGAAWGLGEGVSSSPCLAELSRRRRLKEDRSRL